MFFYKILGKVIQEVMLGRGDDSEQIQEEMRQCYWGLEEEQQMECLKGIKKYVENDMELYMFLLSYLLNLLNDKKIVELIEKILLSGEDMSLLDNINTAGQLWSYLFTHKVGRTEVENFRAKYSLYSRQVAAVRAQLRTNSMTYLPYEDRSRKRVVMLIEPMLGLRHAPTKKMVNIYHYLEELGYEVYVYATNYKQIQEQRITGWWESGVFGALFDENTEFRLNYYGVDVNGCYVMYNDDNYLDTILAICEEIRAFRPLFVMTVGEKNILGDICNEFIDVVTMGCTSSVPVTTSNIIARYFFQTEEMEELYRQCLTQEQCVVEYLHTEELGVEEEAEYTREKLKVGEKDFLIVIAGHRLDDEIKDDTIEVLYTILENEPDCKVLLIGDCNAVKERLESGSFIERFRFVGETENFKMTVGLGNLFLNPPRLGGGGGAMFAVENLIPVLTLGNCDVANVGERFVCERLEDMPGIVHRYINDAAFLEQQREYCRERLREINSTDNLKNTRQFCEEVERIIRLHM